MTTEEKAKAYDEALEDMRAIYPNLKGDAKLAVEHAFPELAESEEERTRKALIETVKCIYAGDTMFLSEQQRDRYLDWLEKQKEQKPEWSEEDIKKIRSEEYTKGFNDAAFVGKIKEWSVEDEDRIRQIERIAQEAGCTQKLQEEIHDWLKSIRKQAKQEWNEEEIIYWNTIKDYFFGIPLDDKLKSALDWLKSLRPSWKPSEEQMEALNVLNLHGDLSYVGQQNQLISLYNDLKKLM